MDWKRETIKWSMWKEQSQSSSSKDPMKQVKILSKGSARGLIPYTRAGKHHDGEKDANVLLHRYGTGTPFSATSYQHIQTMHFVQSIIPTEARWYSWSDWMID